jgi:hypothetical protein
MRAVAGRVVAGWGLGLCLCVSLAAVRPAEAQILGRDRPDRPSRGLFGPDNRPMSQALTFGASLGFGEEKTRLDGLPDGTPSPFASSWSNFMAGSGNIGYTFDRTRFGINSSLNVSGRRDQDGSTRQATDGTLDMVFSAPFSRRTTLDGSMSAGYRPVSLMTVFPSVFATDSSGVPLDYQLTGDVDHYTTGEGQLMLIHALSRRSTIYASAEVTKAWASSTRVDQRTVAGGGGYTYTFVRGLSLRLGYVSRVGDYSLLDGSGRTNTRTDTIDAGIDYRRSIAISRRSSLAFSTGTTSVSDGRTRRFDITGNANFLYEIGRSWEANAMYDRRAGFIDTLAAPSFSDDVSASLDGLITRRISLRAQGGAARGTVGLASGNQYWIYRSAMGVGFAFSRIASLQFDYLNYRYRFDDAQFLPLTSNPRISRQTAQVTLQLWAPIFQRARRPNATR